MIAERRKLSLLFLFSGQDWCCICGQTCLVMSSSR